MRKYYYEKRYNRPDGKSLVRTFNRSFEYGDEFDYFTGEIKEKNKKLKTPEQIDLDFDGITDDDNSKTSNSLISSMSRARNMIKVLAFSNPDLIGMLTLTNADCPTEDEALARFKVFQKKVKRAGFHDFKFLGVKEFQKRGSIHWHLLVNFCPGEAPSPNNKKKKISTLWTYGFSDFVLINGDDFWRTELYLLKYMTKDHLKLFRQYYVRSRNLNLIKPERVTRSSPVPPSASNIFTQTISNGFIDNFVVIDYIVNTDKLTKYVRSSHAQSKN